MVGVASIRLSSSQAGQDYQEIAVKNRSHSPKKAGSKLQSLFFD
ncbi:hypothetical protein D1AOALGA4SA_5947 [Olavius algarvensis Delta 1 endosymbiont]|nr:hypothetical protein D1AOALGA4SA_5947 [Olavius algarvensis Delta 1 endosymbiont]